MNKSVYYEELTTPQLRQMRDDNRIVLFSFGSVEQHSSHLPVGTDILCSNSNVERIAKKTNNIVFAPLLMGYSFNHSEMFSTITLTSHTMLQILQEVFTQFCEQGWKRFIIFSGHAGNWAVIELAVQIVREKYPHACFVIANGLPAMDKKHRVDRFYRNFDYHAGKIETAILAYYFPELIDEENIPNANDVLPDVIMQHIRKTEIDEFDAILINAYTPQKTTLLSKNGNWGIEDPKRFIEIPIEFAMRQYVDFFVKLINRWDSWEAEIG